MRKLLPLALFLLALPAYARHPSYVGTFAGAPTCDSGKNGVFISVTNATNSSTCDGGGSDTAPCWCDGTTWQPHRDGAGSGSPGGIDTQVQFNDSTTFGGDSGLIFQKTTDQLGIGGSPSFSLHVQDTAGAIIAAESTGAFDASFRMTNLTQTWVLGMDQSEANEFVLFDVTGTTSPFSIQTAAANDSLVIDSAGDVSMAGALTLGTNLAAAEINLADTFTWTGSHEFTQDVGIGTSAPATKLHVVNSGTAVVGGSFSVMIQDDVTTGQAAQLEMISGSAALASVYFGDSATRGEGRISYDNSAAEFQLFTGVTEMFNASATVFRVPSARVVDLVSCDTIDTDANGVMSCGVDGGGGSVGASGTPANNQFAVWVDASNVEGIAALTDDGSTFTSTQPLTFDDGAGDSPVLSFDLATAAESFQVFGDDSENQIAMHFNSTASARSLSLSNTGTGWATIIIDIEDGLAQTPGAGPKFAMHGVDPVSANVCRTGFGPGSQHGEVGLWQTDATGGTGSGDCDVLDEFIAWKWTETGRYNPGTTVNQTDGGPWLLGKDCDVNTMACMGPAHERTSTGWGAENGKLEAYAGTTGDGGHNFGIDGSGLYGSTGTGFEVRVQSGDFSTAADSNKVGYAFRERGVGDTRLEYVDDASSTAYQVETNRTTRSSCMVINNLAAADDDTPMPIAAGQTIELVSAFGHCQGTCTTEADLSFEYVEVGTAGPTVTAVTGTVTTEDYITGDSATALSVNTTVTALDVLRFDVDNAVSPETDTYTVCVNYTLAAT